mmetsp:Transcript_11258/g.31233  ORF Transcript_11258/g.31233 Transcript_11258/m.31233 type:complete len:289 (-) Transcript_11258:94-960(-)
MARGQASWRRQTRGPLLLCWTLVGRNQLHGAWRLSRDVVQVVRCPNHGGHWMAPRCVLIARRHPKGCMPPRRAASITGIRSSRTSSRRLQTCTRSFFKHRIRSWVLALVHATRRASRHTCPLQAVRIPFRALHSRARSSWRRRNGSHASFPRRNERGSSGELWLLVVVAERRLQLTVSTPRVLIWSDVSFFSHCMWYPPKRGIIHVVTVVPSSVLAGAASETPAARVTAAAAASEDRNTIDVTASGRLRNLSQGLRAARVLSILGLDMTLLLSPPCRFDHPCHDSNGI